MELAAAPGAHSTQGGTAVDEGRRTLKRLLALAVRADDIGAAESLLARGAEPNARNAAGRTPLFYARSASMTGLLARYGSNLNAVDPLGRTPLVAASRSGNAAVVQALLADGADPRAAPDAHSALEWGAERGHVEVVRLLLRASAGPGAEGQHAESALFMAVNRDHEPGGDDTAHAEVVELLLRHGVAPDARDFVVDATPLMRAGQLRREQTARVLVAAGADVNARDNEGETVLMYAAEGGHTGIIGLLLEAGADVKARAPTGQTALGWAISRGGIDAVRVLVDAGGELRSYPNQTP